MEQKKGHIKSVGSKSNSKKTAIVHKGHNMNFLSDLLTS